MGHESSKNQQLEDHYFGAIPTRVMEFMKELEIESLKLGIPLKTRHNEVAPNQFELAPVFEECNLANDHNLLVMALMRKISRKHGFRVLLHEKPFKGINGSGKHNNWSLGTDTGILLMAPGKTTGRKPPLHHLHRQCADGCLPPQRITESQHFECHQCPSFRS